MAQIFVIYSWQNNDIAQQVIRALQDEHTVVQDWEGEEPELSNPRWWQSIEARIAASDFVVFINSPQALASVVCNLELDAALHLGKRVIPLAYRAVDVDLLEREVSQAAVDENLQRALNHRNPVALAIHHWNKLQDLPAFDVSNDEKATVALDELRTLVTDIAYPQVMHTRFTRAAYQWDATGRQNANPAEQLALYARWAHEVERMPRIDMETGVINVRVSDLIRDYMDASRRTQRERLIVGSMIVGTGIILLTMFVIASTRGAAQRAEITWVEVTGTSLQLTLTNSTPVFTPTLTLTPTITPTYTPQPPLDAPGIAQQATQVVDRRPLLALSLAYEALLIERDSVAAYNTLLNVAELDLTTRAYDVPSTDHLTFSGDGRYFAISRENEIDIWDAMVGERLHSVNGHQIAVEALAFNPNADYLVSASEDTTLVLWEAATGRLVRRYTGHAGRVKAVAFSPDGKRIASGGVDAQLIVWDVETGDIIHRVEAHTTPIETIVFDSDGARIASTASDDYVALTDPTTGDVQRVMLPEAGERVVVAFGPDNDSVIVSSRARTPVQQLDIDTGRVIREMASSATSAIYQLQSSADRRLLLGGGIRPNYSYLWLIETGELLLLNDDYDMSASQILDDGTTTATRSLTTSLQIITLSIPEPDEVLVRVAEERYVPRLTCSEREDYRLPTERQCVNGRQPPMPTVAWTPAPDDRES